MRKVSIYFLLVVFLTVSFRVCPVKVELVLDDGSREVLFGNREPDDIETKFSKYDIPRFGILAADFYSDKLFWRWFAKYKINSVSESFFKHKKELLEMLVNYENYEKLEDHFLKSYSISLFDKNFLKIFLLKIIKNKFLNVFNSEIESWDNFAHNKEQSLATRLDGIIYFGMFFSGQIDRRELNVSLWENKSQCFMALLIHLFSSYTLDLLPKIRFLRKFSNIHFYACRNLIYLKLLDIALLRKWAKDVRRNSGELIEVLNECDESGKTEEEISVAKDRLKGFVTKIHAIKA